MKRETSTSTLPNNQKKRRFEETQLSDVINLGIPHVAEQIFDSLATDDLVQCQKVSHSWNGLLSKRVSLLKQWKGRILEACRDGKTEIVKLLLQHYTHEESGMNLRDICALGATPFMLACYCGQKNVVKLLLGQSDEQIGFNTKDNLGLTYCDPISIEGPNFEQPVMKSIHNIFANVR